MTKSILLLFIAMLLCCQNMDTPIAPTLGEEIEIKFGEQVTIPSEGIRVAFSALLGDSRCPADVTCVWAGNAEVTVQLNDEGIDLNTNPGPERPTQGTISGYTIELVALDPYPESERSTEEEDYVATLLITRD